MTIEGLGLPPVGEGRFYRLTYHGLGMYELQLRERRKRFGSWQIESMTVFEDYKVWDDETESSWHWEKWETPEDAIRAAAERIMEKLKYRVEASTWSDRMDKHLGDHT